MQVTIVEVEVTIKERKAYLQAQEKLISECIESGNSRLMELNHDIALAEKTLKDLRTDIRTASNDKRLLLQDLADLQTEMHVHIKDAILHPHKPVLRSILG